MNKFIMIQIWNSILRKKGQHKIFFKAHHKDSESFLEVNVAVHIAPASLILKEIEI
jgi:hypothetical protein